MAYYRFSIDWPYELTDLERTTWTAPSALRCEDLVMLYEAKSGGRGAFIAVGRALTDAIRAYGGDNKHWAWIEWQPVRRPLALGDARKIVALPSLRSSSSIDEESFRVLAKATVASDKQASAALRRWQDGKGLPRTNELPLHDLILASYGVEDRESALYGPIRKHYERDGWVDVNSEVKAAVRNLRGPLAYDLDGGDHGLRPDIVLQRPRAKRFSVIEVKRAALPTQGYRNPVDQVLDYARAIRKALTASRLSGWEITPILVATEFSPVVLEQAAEAPKARTVGRVECRIWDGERVGSDLVRSSLSRTSRVRTSSLPADSSP